MAVRIAELTAEAEGQREVGILAADIVLPAVMLL